MSIPFVPVLFLVLWLSLIAYAIVLATRLVSAVEQIARALTQHFSESARP
jgi:hypothetical protein